MSKGTIVLIPFPFTDLTGKKVRPAVILYNQKRGEDCIVAFVSSNPQKIDNYSLQIAPTKENGLKVKSTIITTKIATLQKKIMIGELGTLEKENQIKLDGKLKELFGIK